ncbi:TPA: hypothetical protein DCX16_06490, partial [bacterium]|nr:hypothetical protein [bacterium]
ESKAPKFIPHKIPKQGEEKIVTLRKRLPSLSDVCGINTSYVKMLSFVMSAALASIAGVIYVHWIGFVSPESFTVLESILLVCMVVLGGIGSIYGIILGAILLIGLPEFLRSVLGGGEFVLYRMLVFGLFMVLMVILRPQGIIPEKRHEWELKEE